MTARDWPTGTYLWAFDATGRTPPRPGRYWDRAVAGAVAGGDVDTLVEVLVGLAEPPGAEVSLADAIGADGLDPDQMTIAQVGHLLVLAGVDRGRFDAALPPTGRAPRTRVGQSREDGLAMGDLRRCAGTTPGPGVAESPHARVPNDTFLRITRTLVSPGLSMGPDYWTVAPGAPLSDLLDAAWPVSPVDLLVPASALDDRAFDGRPVRGGVLDLTLVDEQALTAGAVGALARARDVKVSDVLARGGQIVGRGQQDPSGWASCAVYAFDGVITADLVEADRYVATQAGSSHGLVWPTADFAGGRG